MNDPFVNSVVRVNESLTADNELLRQKLQMQQNEISLIETCIENLDATSAEVVEKAISYKGLYRWFKFINRSGKNRTHELQRELTAVQNRCEGLEKQRLIIEKGFEKNTLILKKGFADEEKKLKSEILQTEKSALNRIRWQKAFSLAKEHNALNKRCNKMFATPVSSPPQAEQLNMSIFGHALHYIAHHKLALANGSLVGSIVSNELLSLKLDDNLLYPSLLLKWKKQRDEKVGQDPQGTLDITKLAPPVNTATYQKVVEVASGKLFIPMPSTSIKLWISLW